MADHLPTSGNAAQTSPLAQSFQHHASNFADHAEGEFPSGNPGSSNQHASIPHHEASPSQRHDDAGLQRTTSNRSTGGTIVGRSNTLRKQKSLSRKTSLKKSASRKSLTAGSIKGVHDDRPDDYNSVFYTPVPTTGAPTDVLANRFQGTQSLRISSSGDY